MAGTPLMSCYLKAVRAQLARAAKMRGLKDIMHGLLIVWQYSSTQFHALRSLVATLTSATVLCAIPASAQDWPTRPITLVVPLAAGGGSDGLVRIFAPRLSELLGQSVIVENIGGAGGMIGSTRVAKAAPDGYQILLGTQGTYALNQS